MKYILLFLVFCSSLAAAQSNELPLMPYPQHVQVEKGQLRLPKDISISLEGVDAPQIHAALDNFSARIKLQTGISVNLDATSTKNPLLRISVQQPSTLNSVEQLAESYQLHIDKKRISLSAYNPAGIMYGLETLLQLIGTQQQNIQLPLVNISDFPRFQWRGLLLDTSRHFFSVATIKRQLDLMATAKLNVFHWHLTDDQGWRIELQSYPKLHQLASNGEYYTQQEIREVVAYAKARAIHVLPEVDMPGHASAIAIAYPELLSGNGPYLPEIRWGVHSPTLNPANENVYIFADKVIAELTTLFPFEYIHIGGDEVHPDEWNKNTFIQQFMRDKKLSSPQDLQAYFNRRLEKTLAIHKRKMIGWDEVQHPQLPKNTIVQSWRGPDAVSDAVNHGFRALLSTGYYLDQAQPAAYHYRNDPIPPTPVQNHILAANEIAKSWAFSFARKRGAAITGSFTLIYADNKVQRGFIDFKDKSRRELHSIKTHGDQTQFAVDTWMGVLTFSLPKNADAFANQVLVANATYELQAKAIAETPTGISAPQLSPAQHSLILGGEAALWAEIVDESVIDLRLWPRAFAVAERLWSAADKRDEQSMYSRMAHMEKFAIAANGLQSQQQSKTLLKQLAGSDQIKPLQILAQAVEQAQYYHRQHEKMVHASYSKKDPLNQFVDALPPENLFTQNLDKLVDELLQNPNNKSVKKKLLAIFSTWENNTNELAVLINARPTLQSLNITTGKVNSIAALGKLLVERIALKQSLTQKEIVKAEHTIHAAQMLDNEMIVSAAYPVNKLLLTVQTLKP